MDAESVAAKSKVSSLDYRSPQAAGLHRLEKMWATMMVGLVSSPA